MKKERKHGRMKQKGIIDLSKLEDIANPSKVYLILKK
jgi:hypothetical protein